MNVLFMSLSKVWDIDVNDIYSDLLREFNKNGHAVYIVTPVERRYNQKTQIVYQSKATILKVRTLNIQKTNIIEKGLGTILLERQFLKSIKKYFKNIKMDLVIYATPPITLLKPITYIKRRDNALAYLLLKDIFPQNAVDLGMMTKTGIKKIIFYYFKKKEKMLYKISDGIGCMSKANVDYLISNNPKIDQTIISVCPNSIEPVDMSISTDEAIEMRKKYKIPYDRKVFVYGGNLGKPQGIPFLIQCLQKCQDNDKAFFLIVGDGTEYCTLEKYINECHPVNVKLMRRLPKDDYDKLVAACDIGLIFLDHRFTIPNFPSRLLSYMQAGIPVLACTDPITDIGTVITSNHFGWWCESDNSENFTRLVYEIVNNDKKMSDSQEKIRELFSCSDCYETIKKSLLL